MHPALGGIQKVRLLEISNFWSPPPSLPLPLVRRCSFYITPLTYIHFSELALPSVKKNSVTFTNFRMKRGKIIIFL